MQKDLDNLFLKALQKSDLDAVRGFLEKGMDPNACIRGLMAEEDATPLVWAIETNQIDLAMLLLEHGADPQYGVPYPPLMHAVDTGDIQWVKLLHEKGASLDDLHLGKDGGSLLHAACQQGHVEVAAYLVDHGVDVNLVDDRGFSALHFAMENPLTSDQQSLVKRLLEKGANPSKISNYAPLTPLHQAITQGCIELVEALLKSGAPVDPWPTYKGPNHVPCIVSCFGQTPRPEDARILEMLLEYGARADFQSFIDGNGIFHPNLPEYGQGAHVRQDLLHLAAMQHRIDLLDILIKHGADPAHKGSDGRSLVEFYIHQCGPQEPYEGREMLCALIERGAPLQPDSLGNSALHHVIDVHSHGGISDTMAHALIEELIEAKVDPFLKNEQGLTAREDYLLCSCEDDPIAILLKSSEEYLALGSATSRAGLRAGSKRF